MFRAILLSLMMALLGGCAVPKPKLTPDMNAIKLVDAGTLALRQGRLKQAEAAFNMALEISPLPAAIDGLGCVAFLRGDLDTAQRYFLMAYKRDPKYANALGNLALVYERQGDMAAARRIYERALREGPKNYRARNNFAVMLYEDGLGSAEDKDQARLELRKALTLAEHPVIKNNVVKVSKGNAEER
jgi:tetratricopeptide (TPR) repeat protein